MKIPLSILKNFLNTNASTEQICEKLTSIGLEVENIIKRDDLSQFIVAKIVDFEKHLDADKLNVCKVDNGTEILQIVCGAPNVEKGMKVVLAPIGSLIPRDKFTIKHAKIRGIESHGMMCSYSELMLGGDAEGIIKLSDEFEIGKNYAIQAGLLDEIIEIALTPNRGDCANIYGIARDLSATGIGSFNAIDLSICELKNQTKNDYLWNIETEKCMKFGLVKIENVNCISSPLWLKSCIENFGMKSKNLLVDITNYVMMVYGQPMHCYDADTICGKISVKSAIIPEEFVDLKDVKRKIEHHDIIICDNEKILGIAGIIGGKTSAISNETKNIILEAGFFDKNQIAITGQRLYLQTDARFRFERGIDYKITDFALDFATKVILNEVSSAKVIKKDVFGCSYKNEIIIDYQYSLFKKIIGFNLAKEKQDAIITNLGFKIQESNENLCKILVPSARQDIVSSKNIVEEILRIYGYNYLPNTPLSYFINTNFSNKYIQKITNIKKQIASFGYDEVINFVFQDDKIANDIRYASDNIIKLYNPMVSNNASMRQSLLTGLFEKLISFHKYDAVENINIFETGSVFLNDQHFMHTNNIAFLSYGSFGNLDYTKSQKQSSLIIAKTHLFDILSKSFNIDIKNLQISIFNSDFSHPYRGFKVGFDNKIIAYYGEFSPVFLNKFDIKNTVHFSEILDVDNLMKVSTNAQKLEESELQYVYRDFSFKIKKDIKIGNLIDVVYKSDDRIINVNLVDIYENANWENEISISITIKIMQKVILTSEDLQKISQNIIYESMKNFNAILR